MIVTPTRFVTLMRMDDKEVLTPLMDFCHNAALTTLKHLLSQVPKSYLQECCDVAEEHLGFVPDFHSMAVFLDMHQKLKSRVIEFSK